MKSEPTSASFAFTLNPSSSTPFYRQVIHQVELAVADGRLKKGMRLPTVRSLAVELSINPNTVARAYSEMEIRGIVETQPGSGTFVKAQEDDIDEKKRRDILREITEAYITSAASYGFSITEITSYIREVSSILNTKEASTP